MEPDYRQYLTEGPIADGLRKAFKEHKHSLASDAQLSKQDGKWVVSEDDSEKYSVEDTGNELNIYDEELRNDMEKANQIENRWKRREAWRVLAGRIAKISVSVYAKQGFNPGSIAEEYLGQWIMRDGFYSSERGLDLHDDIGYEFID